MFNIDWPNYVKWALFGQSILNHSLHWNFDISW
jgi:hypothetical protein